MSSLDFFQALSPGAWHQDGIVTSTTDNDVACDNSEGTQVSSNKISAKSITSSIKNIVVGGVFSVLIVSGTYAIPNLVQPQASSIATSSQVEVNRGIHDLRNGLEQLRTFKDGWNGENTKAAAIESLAAAQWIIDKLPEFTAEAKVGLDPEGDVYFAFTQGEKRTYLTLEQNNMMHFLSLAPGKERIRRDNVKFTKGRIPPTILNLLTQTMIS